MFFVIVLFVYSWVKQWMLKNGLKIPKPLLEYVNRRTDNTMAKTTKDKQRSTKHHTKN